MKLRFVAALFAIIGLFGAPAVQAAYSGLFIFGDSLSDPGNNAIALAPAVTSPAEITSNLFIPMVPYASTRYTNNTVWAQTFASALGLSANPVLAGGSNFAFGGATTGPISGSLTAPFPPSLLTQTASFLGSPAAGLAASALFVVEGGGNNGRNAIEAIQNGADPTATITATAAQYAQDIGQIVDSLQGAGARSIVVWNVPNLGLAPSVSFNGAVASSLGTSLSAAMNGALATRLAGEPGVLSFDVFGLLTNLVASPATYGLVDVTNACIGGACTVATQLFWDGVHPTSAGHAILASAMIAAVPEPATYAMLLAGLALLTAVVRRRSA